MAKTQPIKLEVELDLDSLLRGAPVYDDDGDIVDSGPTTLEDIVVDRAARQLVDRVTSRVGSDVYQDLSRRVSAIRDEVIVALIEPAVRAAVENPVQRTNDYGAPVGAPVSLHEIIMKRAEAWMTTSSGPSYSDDRRPNIQKVIAEHVDKTFTKELTAAIAAAKKEVVDTVHAKAAEALAGTIVSMAATVTEREGGGG